jgi:hypothetical protein
MVARCAFPVVYLNVRLDKLNAASPSSYSPQYRSSALEMKWNIIALIALSSAFSVFADPSPDGRHHRRPDQDRDSNENGDSSLPNLPGDTSLRHGLPCHD